MSAPEIIDRSADTWHPRVRQYLPFQVRWKREGWPSHWFRTREAAEAAVADAYPSGLTSAEERELVALDNERKAA